MRVFLTGGSGLVGSHAIEKLVAAGHEVSALSRTTAADEVISELGATPVRGTLEDQKSWNEIAADAIVHCAALLPRRASRDEYHHANVVTTSALALRAKDLGARFVHISSIAVYGNTGRSRIDEDTSFGPQRTHDYYSRSKRDAERAVWRAADDGKLNAAALRPGVVYGERDRTFSNRIFRSFDAGIFPIIGSGNNHLGVVYAGNVGDAVARAVTCDATGPFNVASDGYVSQADFFAILASHKRNRVRFVRVPKAAAMAGALTVYWYKKIVRRGRYGGFPTVAVNFLSGDNPYSCDRARAQLSWRPSTDPTTAVDRTGAWLRAAER